MYKIDKKTSGYVLTFSGSMDSIEMQNWVEESKIVLQNETSRAFGVIIDMKDLLPISVEASDIMKSGQKLYKEKGMVRSAVIVNSPKLRDQFKNIAVQTGIYTNERYIDASSVENPQKLAVDWVKAGIDPDKIA